MHTLVHQIKYPFIVSRRIYWVTTVLLKKKHTFNFDIMLNLKLIY